MNLASLRAELETDRAWRDEEIANFYNRGAAIESEVEQQKYRRVLVLLLYLGGHPKPASRGHLKTGQL